MKFRVVCISAFLTFLKLFLLNIDNNFDLSEENCCGTPCLLFVSSLLVTNPHYGKNSLCNLNGGSKNNEILKEHYKHTQLPEKGIEVKNKNKNRACQLLNSNMYYI